MSSQIYNVFTKLIRHTFVLNLVCVQHAYLFHYAFCCYCSCQVLWRPNVFPQCGNHFHKKEKNNYIYIFTKSGIITKILLWTEALSSYSENQKLWIVSSTNFFVLYVSDAAQDICSVCSSNLHKHCVPDKPMAIWSML